jgi:hypothetical protein
MMIISFENPNEGYRRQRKEFKMKGGFYEENM